MHILIDEREQLTTSSLELTRKGCVSISCVWYENHSNGRCLPMTLRANYFCDKGLAVGSTHRKRIAGCCQFGGACSYITWDEDGYACLNTQISEVKEGTTASPTLSLFMISVPVPACLNCRTDVPKSVLLTSALGINAFMSHTIGPSPSHDLHTSSPFNGSTSGVRLWKCWRNFLPMMTCD